MSLPAFIRSLHAGPHTRRLLRVCGWLSLGLYFAAALTLLALRYAVLPQVGEHRGDIEAALSHSLKLPVSIGAIDAGWSGLRPRLVIRGLTIRDSEGRPALGFDNVEAELAWSSLWHGALHLHRLEIVAPDLDIRRDADGRYFVAGLEVTPSSSGGGFADWLLAQDRIVVRDAALRWHDERRGAPPLALRQLNFDLHNDGSRHRFGFTAEPPPQLAARLDVRGDLRGRDIDALDAWKGDAYAELDYADLAVWRTWVDYPIELPRGNGGLRIWLSFAQRQLAAVTADLRLAGVDVRVAPELPMLELTSLEGRLAARKLPEGVEVQARQLRLATADGIRLDPADLRLSLRHAAAGRAAGGELETSGLDLGALAALAARLPIDDATRGQLLAYRPQGRLHAFKLSWTGSPGQLQGWRVAGNFAGLGLAATEDMPAGFAGLSGSVDGNDKDGRLTIDARQAALELPSVFADPRLDLAALSAQLKWRADAGGVDVDLVQASFSNDDANGEASGRYRRARSGGPGEIDLNARLTQAAGNAVWRYMPLVVNRDVRDWLRGAITGGMADEATLRLKGDLRNFPFRDASQGIFEVKGRFRGATLQYAPGWPEIRDIEGSLLFHGARMVIEGHKGSISGVGIGPVTAEIADLDAPAELLTVEGRAAGATGDFLAFIEASPVGERIDHFTEDMTAQGRGELQLKLALPLRHITDTKIDGRFRFINDRIVPDPDMPPLSGVNGELRFTGSRLDAQKIQATLLGMPLSLDIATAGDGSVGVKASGTLAVAALRQQYGHPLLDHLSGSAPWTGALKVRKKSVDLHIESNLLGIASSLPEPFNKRTNSALPLVVERKQATQGGRDTLSVAAGDVVKALLMRRHEGARTSVERGFIALGTAAPKLPERGLLLAAQARRIDADFWRRLFEGGGGNGNASPITAVDVRADEFITYGRSITGLRLSAAQTDNLWKADVRSGEVAGNVEWNGAGAGKISGHLTRLALPEASGGKAGPADIPDELPAVDLTIDRFAAGSKEFGVLRLKAGNEQDGYWNARFDIRNDEATLEGNGRWRPKSNPPETRLEFKLATKSIEKTLVRLGYPDAVRRGTANLDGNLSWNGGPLNIDYPSLSGHLKFEAAGGQFNKLEPGVGRLLGVLSLQSLPRRLTLDFRDVFSEGFAFDAIAGEANISHGIMTTQNLQIAGPAARVLMTGGVDLDKETQNLKVRVQPAIGETLATGVLLAHPVAGAAAWVFNKLFGNPFDQAFAYEYGVTGTWDDPKVEKLAGPAAGAEGKKGAP